MISQGPIPPNRAQLPSTSADFDGRFYFTNVIFLVDGTLFRVPRHPFAEDSEVFGQMFQLPAPEDTEPDGSSYEHPIHLDGIKKDDFRQLLKVLFPALGKPESQPQTLAEWTPVLKLSSMWEFELVKKVAVEKMQSFEIDPVEKACLAKECDVPQWLVPALNEIAKRREPIGVEDVEKLGLDLALKMAAVRESLAVVGRYLRVGERSAECLDFTQKIKTVLAIEVD
ncbi:hypothetical protein BV22DRAFT_1126329 [Leucogyrophana mollusca]|uniref:Uncharacterized protein n=1 Tax=Leucogyrophana mollusca TaxID=85980 RepID=A0ACB8BTF1_9AGAM|nr:hypothetical protein BV22DRAFT_1126329 [Leucogyrophana mollusca]